MAGEIKPEDTSRAYELWMEAPNPEVSSMDGAHAGRFLANLQNEINSLK